MNFYFIHDVPENLRDFRRRKARREFKYCLTETQYPPTSYKQVRTFYDTAERARAHAEYARTRNLEYRNTHHDLTESGVLPS